MKTYATYFVALVWAVFGAVSCAEQKPEDHGVDQCLRREIFESCLGKIPKGPDHPAFNDWNEVVSECASVAYYQAWRSRSAVEPKCFLKIGR